MANRFVMILFAGFLAGSAPAQDAPALKSQKEKLSYALGMDLGNQFRRQSTDVDPALLYQGLKDALAGGKTLLTEEETRAIIAVLQNELAKKQAEANKILAEKNQKEGEAYLAANKGKEGIVVLPSGLQYKILKQAEGTKPAADDTVVCHYRGTLIDGTEFDSSYKRNQPATFAVKGIIKGWTEALQLMTVGSKWQLWIPAELAYGERARSNIIGPNSTLIFEVELISIQSKF